jgi:hypothetical protein
MSAMKFFLTKLFGAGRRLSTLERLVLDAARASVDPSLHSVWDRQVLAINKVQRLPEGIEVNFYRMHKGRPSFDEDLAFPNRTTELLIAEVRISLDRSYGELVAHLWCVRGFLFSIEYSGHMSYYEEAAGMDPPPGFMIECEKKSDLSLVVPTN